MALLIGYDPAGLDGKVKAALDAIVAAIQTWAGTVDGVNAAQRLNELASGISSLPTVQVGTLFAFAGDTAPAGYLLCDGSAVSRTTYANLFTVIGVTYGAGNGSTTFDLPDLRERVPLGRLAGGVTTALGSTGGTFNPQVQLVAAGTTLQGGPGFDLLVDTLPWQSVNWIVKT